MSQLSSLMFARGSPRRIQRRSYDSVPRETHGGTWVTWPALLRSCGPTESNGSTRNASMGATVHRDAQMQIRCRSEIAA